MAKQGVDKHGIVNNLYTLKDSTLHLVRNSSTLLLSYYVKLQASFILGKSLVVVVVLVPVPVPVPISVPVPVPVPNPVPVPVPIPTPVPVPVLVLVLFLVQCSLNLLIIVSSPSSSPSTFSSIFLNQVSSRVIRTLYGLFRSVSPVQGWEKVCSTKKMNRFHPPEVKQGLQQLEIAKEHLQAAALAAWEAFLAEFALHYAPFRSAVMALASLDALHSLATLACNPGYAYPSPHMLCSLWPP